MLQSARIPRALAALALALAVIAVGCGGDDGDDGATPTQGASAVQTETTPAPSQEAERTTEDEGAEALDGGELFTQRCGSCHTLAAADTSGQIGPNLDQLRPDEQTVLTAIERGPGAMPPRLYEGAEAQAVARYVAEHAGR